MKPWLRLNTPTVPLLAACPNRSYLEAHGFGLERFIAEPLNIEDGFAIAPDRPGHGIGLERISEFERVNAHI